MYSSLTFSSFSHPKDEIIPLPNQINFNTPHEILENDTIEIKNKNLNSLSIYFNEITEDLNLQYHDFRICVELPILAKFRNLRFISLPSKERKRIGGKKKVNALKDGFLILTAIIYLYYKKFSK